MLTWRGGTRLLTIIDEALANAIENSKVTNEDLSQALAYINFLPKALQEEHRTQIAELERMRDIIAGISLKQDRTATWVWQSSNTSPIELDLGPLRSAMWQLRYDLIVMRRRNSDDRKRVAEIVDSTLHHAELIADQWAYYAQKGSDLSINSAALLVPLDVPGPVVLDATARANFLWKLLEERAEIVGGLPDGVRDYSSVTLHVARAPKLGKNSMVKHIERRWPRTISEMEKQLGPDRALLAVMHLDVEYKALTYKNHFQRFATAHWNAIDGKNKWADFDAALILGMPYRDQVWSTNVFCALQGPTDNDWLKEPRWQEFEDVRAVLEQRQLSVSIIQAINRICCRRVVDDAGRCPPCDIYILLPSNETGDAILADINADMPGLVVTDWAFELDGPQVRRVRSGSSHDALLAFMSSVLPGKIAMSSIGKELGLSSSGLTKLREALRDASHPTTQALAGMGVSYASRGRGPGAASYLVKADR